MSTFKPTLVIQFLPGEDEVLGVFGDLVHVRGMAFYDKPEEDEPDLFECVMKIDTDEYLRVIKKWLDSKKIYCEKYDEYCDVSGSVCAKDYYEDEPAMLSYWNEATEKMEPEEIPTFYVLAFEDDVECDEEEEEI